MKHKVLLAGKNTEVMTNFFNEMGTAFECMTTSTLYEDMKNHIAYFDPDIFVFCPKGENREEMALITSFHSELVASNVPLAVLCAMSDYEIFKKTPDCALELFVQMPISNVKIERDIVLFLNNRANNKRKAAGLRKASDTATASSMDTLNLLAQVEAELAMMDTNEKSANDAVASSAYSDKKRILVIDDDANMLKTIKGHLDDGYEVATALSGALAKRFLTNKQVDLILLDYEMPNENGAEVLKYLRSMPNTRNIPVVFLTGVNDTSKIQEVLSLKPQGYLLKPVNHDTLVSKITSIIG